MVAVDGGSVKGRHKVLHDDIHGTAVARDGCVVDLAVVLKLAEVIEGETVVLLAHIGAAALGDGVHSRHSPEAEVSAVGLVEQFGVDVGGVALDVGRMDVLVVEQAGEHQRIQSNQLACGESLGKQGQKADHQCECASHFFLLLEWNRSPRPLKSFFMIRPMPCVLSDERVK